MRVGYKLRLWMQGRRLPARKQRRILAVICFILAGLIFLYAIAIGLTPLIEEAALAEITTLVTSVINQAINQQMAEGHLDYAELVTLEKNASGEVTALMTNMSKINQLQADVVNGVIELLNDERVAEISIPIGNIIGGNFLSGRGPEIPVKILSLSSVQAQFYNDFSSAWINQTRHRIMLDIEVDLVFLFSWHKASEHVSVQVNVAETVIVGSVPDSYTYFENTTDAEDAIEKYFNFN